ncbi:MAG: amidohydrolase family protein [Desulfobacteraceae bacterium]|nr:amidohydrolase family protein [Desulfobacteraceae bacterium]
MYDLLLKSGLVIDPANDIHEVRDVAVKNGKVAIVEKNITHTESRTVVPVHGRLVTPGLIDVHCHLGNGSRPVNADPDLIGIHSGVTLLCDGGTTGAANFNYFRGLAAGKAKTDLVCFLNLAVNGMVKDPEITGDGDIDIEATKNVIEANRDVIKGIKLRAVTGLSENIGIIAIETAKKLATEVNLPLMLHIGEPRTRVENDALDCYSRESVGLLEKGDIISHFMRMSSGGLVLEDGTVYPELIAARKRGVVLDSCHGMGNFSFAAAEIAIRNGLVPDVISTDMGYASQPIVQSLLVTMSKVLNMGLTIDQVVAMTTINPANAIGEDTRFGSLTPGSMANVLVMENVEGDYLFSDGYGGGRLQGTQLLEPRLILKNGISIPCLSR